MKNFKFTKFLSSPTSGINHETVKSRTALSTIRKSEILTKTICQRVSWCRNMAAQIFTHAHMQQ